MKQFLWIGCLESDEEFKIKAAKGYDLASAQVSQKNIISGMEEITGIIFDTINGSVLPPCPVYKDREVNSVKWEHKPGSFDISVGYRNDKYINRINCRNAMINAAKDWIQRRYQGDELIVCVYSMRSAPMATACYIKEKAPKAQIYLIVTDLPQFMDLGQNKLKTFLKKIDWISIKRMQKHFDGFILYEKKMAEFLRIPNQKWILMEGSYDCKEMLNETDSHPRKALMYSGKLDKEYGIPMLLEAFMGIEDQDAELWFTGGGNAEDMIKKAAEKDRRIKFYGFLPTREDVLRKQRKAKALINMRLPSEPASAYCFPSKLFEYMASGVPVLSFKLGGIPEEYYEYLIAVETEDADELRDKIKYAMGLSVNQQIAIGNGASKFVIYSKDSISQSRKIVEFIRKRSI